jgi:DNA-binding winged helix-turn-helix (wHTH) protein/tetratricopeptide (TPR) repeat protein
VTSGPIYGFGEFRLDIDQRVLSRGSSRLRVSPKAFDLLVLLLRQPGRVMTKETLLARLWPDVSVEEGTLAVHISVLRKTLNDEMRPFRYIETVPKVGYRFIASVEIDGSLRGHSADGKPLELFELVGRGRSHYLTGSSLHLPSAESAFRAAIALDPSYGPGHAGLALTLCAQAYNRVAAHGQAYAEARVAALRALAMDPGSADAQAALGTVLFHSEWDWSGAERSLCRALEVNPDHTEALLQYGALQDAIHGAAAGLPIKQQALERAPYSPLVLLEIAVSYLNQHRFADAMEWARKAIAVDATNPRATELIGVLCLSVCDLNALIVERRRRVEAFAMSATAAADNDRWCVALRDAQRTAGMIGVLRFILQTLPPDETSRGSIHRSGVYAALGDLDSAFHHLDRAISLRDPVLVYLKVAPLWDRLRGDARFAERLTAMKLLQDDKAEWRTPESAA